MDEKQIFLLNVNKDTNDNLYKTLIEIKKLSPSTRASTTSILHIKERPRRQMKYLERALMVASREKVYILKYTIMGHNLTIVYFLSQVLLL